MKSRQDISRSPYVVGAGLGLVNAFAFATAGRGLGITSAFENAAALTERRLAPDGVLWRDDSQIAVLTLERHIDRAVPRTTMRVEIIGASEAS